MDHDELYASLQRHGLEGLLPAPGVGIPALLARQEQLQAVWQVRMQ